MGKYGDAVNRVSKGGFMKLQDGDNRLRFLTDPVVQRKAFRVGEVPTEQFSWYVWNYSTESIEILTKGAGFIRNVDALMEEWGEEVPMKCDVVIKKKGSGLETKYTWVASPIKDELPKEWDKDLKPLTEVLDGAIDIASFGNGDDPTEDFSNLGEDAGEDPFAGMDVQPKEPDPKDK